MPDKQAKSYVVTMYNNKVTLPVDMKDYYAENVVVTFSAKEIKNAILIFKESDFSSFLHKMEEKNVMSDHMGKLIGRTYTSNCYQSEIGEKGELYIPEELFAYIGMAMGGTAIMYRDSMLGIECLVVWKQE